jgi:hypothetical protein
MTPTEIISADLENHGKNPQQDLTAIAQAIQAKKATLLQEGNSVLFILFIGENEAELHLYSQDAPISVAKALKIFIEKIRQTEIKTVYGSEEPTQTLQLLSKLGVNVEKSDNPKYKWMAKVA